MINELKNRVRERVDVPFKNLTWFQGKLKFLTDKKAETLKNALEQVFINPFLIWDDNGKYKILDGHQRYKILQDNGYNGIVPCVKIHCENEKEAAKFVLMFASVFGQVDYETLYEYVTNYDLSIETYENVIDIPDIDIQEFRIGYLEDGTDMSEFFIDKDVEKKEESDRKIICPECGADITGKI